MVVQVKDGSFYEGILHAVNSDKGFGVILQMARKKEKTNGEPELILTMPKEKMVISPQDFVHMFAQEVTFVEDAHDKKRHQSKKLRAFIFRNV